MITLAPELENSTEVIKYLTSNGVTVSLGMYCVNDCSLDVCQLLDFFYRSFNG